MSNRPDSISSGAAYYSNPYRQDPGFRQADRVAVGQRKKVDSIQKLEKELQNQLPPGPIVLAVEVGRYIILAIFLPPYYVLFKAPKWLFLQAKPFILKGLEKGEALLKLVQSFIALHLKNLVQKPLKILQKLFKLPKMPFRTTEFPARVAKALIKPFQAASHQLKKVIPYFQTKFQALKKTILHQTKQLYPNSKKLIQKALHHLQNRVQKRVEKIKPYLQKINAALDNVVSAISTKIQKAIQNTFVLPIKTVYQFVIQKIAIPVKTLIKETIQKKVTDPIKRAITAVVKPVKTIAKHVSNRIQKTKEHVKAQLKRVLKVISSPVGLIQSAYTKAIPPLKAYINSFIVPFLNFTSKTVRIGNTLKRGVQRVAGKGKDYLKEKMAKLKEWGAKGKKVLLIIFKKIEQIYSSFMQRLKRLLAWIRVALAKIAKFLKIAYIWVKILVRYSLAKKSK